MKLSLLLVALLAFCAAIAPSVSAVCSTQPGIQWGCKYYGWGSKNAYVKVTVPVGSDVASGYTDSQSGWNQADIFDTVWHNNGDGTMYAVWWVHRPDDYRSLPVKLQVNVKCPDGSTNPVVVSSDSSFAFCFIQQCATCL